MYVLSSVSWLFFVKQMRTFSILKLMRVSSILNSDVEFIPTICVCGGGRGGGWGG